jgi:endoglucanase
MNVMKTAMLFIIGSLFVWNKNYAQTATRIPITTIVPSINTGQNYSPWLNDYTSSLISNVWTSSNMQYIDVKAKLQSKSNISKLSLYDFEGIFTDHPCKIYALNGTTKTLIATFYGYQYMQWVDFNLPSAVTADAIVVNKWGNCLPMKIKVFGTPATSTGTAPAAITGASTVCVGATTALANTTSGGVWSSSATTRATVSTYGVVTGVSAGTATISYTKSGASATKVVTVNGLPTAGAVSGAATVAVGVTTPFSSSAPGGTWSSSASYNASVNASGVVTGVAAGTASINYAVTNGCGTSWAWKTVTVNPAPTAGAGTITGASSVCTGAYITLTKSVAGGVWSSTAPGIATVNASGVVTGVAAGTATIKYTVGSAVATKIVTVNAAPSAGVISGTGIVNVGSTAPLYNTVTGGAWSSLTPTKATVNTSGVVTGVAAGTATIKYVVSNTCGSATATKVVTVNAVTTPPTPGAGTISGASTVCVGATTALINTSTGGAWSSSSTARATVNTSGLVTGVSAGTATISYTVGAASATKVITVNALPTAATISGGSSVVAGSTTGLTASVAGGSWSSSSTGVASVNASGIVTGITAGSVTISYTVSNSCGSAVATKAISVTAASTGGGTGGGTPVTGKIPMDGKRWYILNNCSDGFEGLHDNNLTTSVITGYGTILSSFDAYYPVLPGETINISSMKFYDGPGTSAAFKVYAVDASWNRTLLATYTGAAYNTWVGPNGSTTDFNLTAPANNVKYLVVNASNNQYPFEMELYGSYVAPPAATPVPTKSIKLKQELGVNAFEWDFLHPSSPLVINETRMNAIKSFGAVRHYLDWEKLEPTQGGYTFNPSHSGGWNMDIIYQRAKAEGIEMLVDIKTLPGWFQATFPGGIDGEGIPANSGSDWKLPASYIKQAKLGFQFAARYGSNASVPTSLLSVDASTRWSGDPANTVQRGLNTVKYVENENERDKWWKGRNAYQTGREYAANLSAFYDGHKNTMGAGVGVKNADPNMKVVMGGVAMPTTDWLEGMIDWCKEFRGYNTDGSINLCWDVINYHIYPDNNKSMQGGGTRGAAPEVAHADSFAVKFIRVAHQYCKDMPVWITETGYDLNSGSPVKAIPVGTKSAQVTQADWSLRHALLNARTGVEYTYFYMLDDVNASSGTQFSSCGLVNSDFSRRPVADYMWQTKRLMGEYEYKETISANPIVDRYELSGQSIYVVTKPTENGSTMAYTLPVSGAASVKIYRPAVGQDSMSVTTASVSGGGVALTATETPMFIKVGTGSGARMAPTDTTSDVLPTNSLNNALAKSIAVYPNPTTGVMQLSVNNDQQGEVNIVVYNTAGQVSKKQVFTKAPGTSTQTVDISSLPSGMYIMEITQGTEKATKKVIKVNN